MQLRALLFTPLLVASVTADCWDRKCSMREGYDVLRCKSACRGKGYPASGIENYLQAWPPRANTVCTCGTYHSEDCGTCSRRGTPCKSRSAESKEFYGGRVPTC